MRENDEELQAMSLQANMVVTTSTTLPQLVKETSEEVSPEDFWGARPAVTPRLDLGDFDFRPPALPPLPLLARLPLTSCGVTSSGFTWPPMDNYFVRT